MLYIILFLLLTFLIGRLVERLQNKKIDGQIALQVASLLAKVERLDASLSAQVNANKALCADLLELRESQAHDLKVFSEEFAEKLFDAESLEESLQPYLDSELAYRLQAFSESDDFYTALVSFMDDYNDTSLLKTSDFEEAVCEIIRDRLS